MTRSTNEYKVRRFDAEKTRLDKLQKQHRGAVLLVPEVAQGRSRFVDVTDLKRLKHQTLAEFGIHPVVTRYIPSHKRVIYAPDGNPRFLVVRL